MMTRAVPAAEAPDAAAIGGGEPEVSPGDNGARP